MNTDAQRKETGRVLGGFPLMSHQARGAGILAERARFGLFFDTGTGKTATILAAVEDSWPLRVLVVCPLALVQGAWALDCAKFCPEIPFLDLHAVPTAQRKEAIARFPAGIAAINYEAFKASIPALTGWRPDMLVADESSKLKNPKAKISKAVRAFAAGVPRVYLLSGTPAPNGPLEYWVQGSILGAPWGRSFYGWRASVARPYGYGGHEWRVTDQGEEAIRSDLAKVSWHVHKDDVLDLPERTFVSRNVTLSDAERDAYLEMKRHFLATIDGEVVSATGVLPQLAKLRQATSGFFYSAEGSAAIRVGTSKLDALSELLEEIGNHSVVLWCHYREEGARISDLLGRRAVEYSGRIAHQQRAWSLTEFLSGRAQYLLANPQSIGHGVTLTVASYAVWASGSYSYEQYHQANDRIYRYGQRNACTYYHLLAPGTVDELMLGVVQGKAKAASAVLEWLKAEKKGTQ